jgi:hypothetical protein
MKQKDPDPHPDPDPLVRGVGPRVQVWILIKMSWIRNTDNKSSHLCRRTMGDGMYYMGTNCGQFGLK